MSYYTDEDTETEKQPEPEPQKSNFLEGICGECLGTGFKHTVRNGVLGVLYTAFNQDTNGKPVKKIMLCAH